MRNKAVSKLQHLVNGASTLRYGQWKLAEKSGRDPNDRKLIDSFIADNYEDLLFEKILLKRLKPIIEDRDLTFQIVSLVSGINTLL